MVVYKGRRVTVSNIGSITISSDVYNVTQATAVKQKTLMTLIGAKITINSAMSGVEEINTQMLKGALLSLPEDTLDKVSSIVLWKTVKSGDDKLVTLDNFQSGMNDYFTLLAEAVKLNLSDFFTWLDSVNAENRTPKQTIPSQ